MKKNILTTLVLATLSCGVLAQEAPRVEADVTLKELSAPKIEQEMLSIQKSFKTTLKQDVREQLLDTAKALSEAKGDSDEGTIASL